MHWQDTALASPVRESSNESVERVFDSKNTQGDKGSAKLYGGRNVVSFKISLVKSDSRASNGTLKRESEAHTTTNMKTSWQYAGDLNHLYLLAPTT
jgi:hypothetical protein